MNLNKYLAIACVVLALTNCLNLKAMEDLNEQLWQATYGNDQKEIKELLEAGANVNNPDKYGSTVLGRYVSSAMGDYDKKRADFIIDLLAANADPKIAYDYYIARGTPDKRPYLDQPQVIEILKNMIVSAEEIAPIQPAILKQLPPITTVEKLFFIPEVKEFTRRKLTAIRSAVPATDWESYDKNKLQHAIELQILNAIPEAKAKFPGTFVTYNLSIPEPVAATPQPEPVVVTAPVQKDNLKPVLEALAQALTALEQQLSVQPKTQPTPQPQPVAATSEKISNEKLWAEIYRRNPSFGKVGKVDNGRSDAPWRAIRQANATTRAEVENALIGFLLEERRLTNQERQFSEVYLDRFEEYIKNPSPALLKRFEAGGAE